ncbi:hypothetical protein EK0264_09485 [Epidermidibacterium keratini]|uniref:Uncharacterized protein n=1 Tax=Epidermidibacterium keratini TaxID=1891644 RepID=A0A7L4YNV5_9ACTN|nr:hypothetical protein [Epidermidibacterium keratini]QHC00489.1 hypothetical protein EK0264_09485 [Epidermidibacterium keratini]
MTDPSQSAPGAGSACPDVDTLADYQAGVLDEQTSAEIAAHVAADPRCQQVLAALDATVAQLRSMPPVRMPENVAARINAALAAEAGRGSAPRLHAVPPATDLDQSTTAAPTAAGPAPLTAAAGERTAPSTVPPRGSDSNVSDLSVARAKRSGRAKMWLAAAAAAVVVGGGTALIATQSGGDGADTNVAEQTSQSSEQNQDSAPGSDVLAFGSPSDVLDKGAITDDKVSPDVAGEMAERSARNQCLNEMPNRPLEAPEAVQKGEYDGQEAYAFIFPTANPDEIQMIVVAASDCSVVLDEQTGQR